MPQSLDSTCGVIELFLVVDYTASTIIPPIPYGMTTKLYSIEEINARKSKAALIDDNNSSSTTESYCEEYKSQFGLSSEYCDRFELKGSRLLTSKLI